MNRYIQKAKENKKFLIIFLVIMLLAIFLRTYKFHDLMRFGTDQARDAAIIRDIINGKEPLPMLGPKAGGTIFKMGPICYYFQYASGKVFGAGPDKLAYPDLFFSIFTIPIFFFFLRKYFDKKISLSLTALFSISFFAVQYGRFAWNPNSLPLFTMIFIYAFLELANSDQQKKGLWATIAGIALGIGVQLHTLFILVMGIAFLLFSLFLWRKKLLTLKNIALVIIFAIFLNVPQLVSEIKTGGNNTKAFFTGITQKSTEIKDPTENSRLLDPYWHAQSNAMFVSAIGDDNDSDFWKLESKLLDNKKGIAGIKEDFPLIFILILDLIFSLSGYVLLIYFLKKEGDTNKKIFLQFITLYIFLFFLVLIPLSHVLMLRYFLMLQFVPFFFLGFIIKFLLPRYGKNIFYYWLAALVLLGALNVHRVLDELNSFKNGNGKLKFAMWGESEFIGNFIASHSTPSQRVYMVYEPQNANKYIRPLSYFAKGISFPAKPNTGAPLEENDVAYFSMILNTKKEIGMQERRFSRQNNYSVTDSASFGRLLIYKLELKKNTNTGID